MENPFPEADHPETAGPGRPAAPSRPDRPDGVVPDQTDGAMPDRLDGAATDQPEGAVPGRLGVVGRVGELWRGYRTEVLIALLIAGIGAALGGPVGLLWRAVAPTVPLVKTQYGWYPTQPEPEGYVADDVWFAMLGAAAGVLLALGAWFLARRVRGPVVLVAVVAGSLAGALLAEWLGHRIGLSGYQAQVRTAAEGARLQRLVSLRSDIARLVAPTAAAVVYLLLASFHYAPSLRDGDHGPDPEAVDPDPDPDPDAPDPAVEGAGPAQVSSASSGSPGH